MINRTRTKTFVLLGVAVVLIMVALVSWRPFGSSSPSGTVPTRTPLPERVLHFPEDHSIGRLFVRDWNSALENDWILLGQAEGTVKVPLGKELRFMVSQQYQDLSPLAEIGEHDLQSLTLGGGINLKLAEPNGTYRIALYSRITDDDLRFIRELSSLRELALNGAKITDLGIAQLSGLTSLESLSLANTDIGDATMEQIGNLTSLSELDISNTKVSDKGMAEIGRLPSLRRLFLGLNVRISDTGLMHLRSLTRLEVLDLSATSITDKGLAYLQSMRSLKRLSLYGRPQITPNGLASLKRALPECRVFVNVTPIPTPIPPTRPPIS